MFRGTRPEGRRSLRPSVSNKLAIGAVVACSFATFAAQGASAAGCGQAECFNHGVLEAAGTAANIITPSAQMGITPTITGPGTAPNTFNYQVTPSNATFPTFKTVADGYDVTINTQLKNNAQGTLDVANGALTMAGDFESTVTLATVPGSCTLDTGKLNMSTTNTQPLMGVDFPSGGASEFAAGAGAFGGRWSSLSATPVPSNSMACVLLTAAGFTGPGGLWISRNLTPPSPTVTHNSLKPVKAGKTETVKIKVANSGQVGTGAIKLCLKAPRHFKVNKRCQTVANVAGGKTDVVTFKVKTSRKHRPRHTKTYKLTLTPSTTTEGLAGNKGLAAQVIKFKVKR